jgi:hypothetical protein
MGDGNEHTRQVYMKTNTFGWFGSIIGSEIDKIDFDNTGLSEGDKEMDRSHERAQN